MFYLKPPNFYQKISLKVMISEHKESIDRNSEACGFTTLILLYIVRAYAKNKGYVYRQYV